VDLIGMDVTWTAEFANAGWIKQFPDSLRKEVTDQVFPSVIKTASFRGQALRGPRSTPTRSSFGTARTWCRRRRGPGVR